jgi:multiple sugar transport system substrate-binding protein
MRGKAVRTFRALTAALTLVLVVAACGGGGGDGSSGDGGGGGQITLEFPTWQAEDKSFSPWWKDLIAEYTKQHPNVKIDFYQIPFDSFVDQMTTRFAGNDPPDIVHLPARNAGEFASRGWLEPLDERLAGTDILQNWTPLQEEMRWDGKTEGVLLLGYGYGLFYNSDLLEKAGVEVPTTPEELVAATEKLTKGDVYGFGATTQQNPDNYTELSAFVVGNGGAWSNDAGQFIVNDPKVRQSLEQFREVVGKAPKGLQSQQRNELFLNGKIAMLLDGPFMLPELDGAAPEVKGHLKVARAPFPQVPGGVSNSLHLPAGLEQAKADAAWDFIKLATSPEWQQRYTQSAAAPAPRKGSVTPEALSKTPELELFGQLNEQAVTIFPSDPKQREQFGKISDAVSTAAIRLITSDTQVGEIADQLQQDLQRAVGS